ncbi:hypothetical protein [Streptomyces hawaiiensis]|uniref:hypothetical protein n=1 Tax=Streptomyces hawaiiensis TaxID=67305 RepID=UPI00366877D6
MTAMAQDVAVGALREKRKKRQAKLMPTVLIVDLSGNDLPDLRRWPETFGALWGPDDEFLAVGGMTVSTRSREPELRFSLNPFTEPQTLRRFAALVSGCDVFIDLAEQAKGTRRRAG